MPRQPAGADDLLELRRLVEAYALAADRGDGEAVGALFTEDGELAVWMDPANLDATSDRRGRAAIAASIGTLSRYDATHHTISASAVRVVGDVAEGETRCEAHHVEATPQGRQDRVLYVRYSDDFARTDAGWRFARRELRVRWVSILPVES